MGGKMSHVTELLNKIDDKISFKFMVHDKVVKLKSFGLKDLPSQGVLFVDHYKLVKYLHRIPQLKIQVSLKGKPTRLVLEPVLFFKYSEMKFEYYYSLGGGNQIIGENGLMKQREEDICLRIRCVGTKRQSRKFKASEQLVSLVGDLGVALPKGQETKSGRVDNWLMMCYNTDGMEQFHNEDKTFSISPESRSSDNSYDQSSSIGSIINETEANHTPPGKWENTFVGYYYFDEGQILSSFDLQESLIEQLQEFKYCKISRLNDDGFYAFKFSKKGQELVVLEHGQLFIDNKPLILKRWSCNLALVPSLFLSALPIWIRYYNLNWSYWSQICLSKISSIIGVPLFMDKCTATMGRLDYARVCVEVDTNVLHLPETVHMLRNGKIIPISVEYEWKPQQCLLCLSIYHHSDSCKFDGGRETLKWHQKGNGPQGRLPYDDDGSVETISLSSGPEYVESSIAESLDDELQERMMFVQQN